MLAAGLGPTSPPAPHPNEPTATAAKVVADGADPFVLYARSLHDYTLHLWMESRRQTEERVRARGLVGRVRVHLMDYRDVPAHWEHAFDTFVSSELGGCVCAAWREGRGNAHKRVVGLALFSPSTLLGR